MPAATGKIAIDGDGSDPAWGAAFFTDDLRRAFVVPEKRVPMSAELTTTFGLTFDKDNIYVLATVKDRYVVEMRIPAAKVCPIVDGDVWRIQCTRNRLVKDALTPNGNGRWCFEGEAYLRSVRVEKR